MVFSNLVFICCFLPAFLLLYFLSGNVTYKNIVLLLFSLFFYAWGEPVWVILLIFSGTLDYVVSILITRFKGTRIAALLLITSLCANLGLLVVFKYSVFFVSNINSLLKLSLYAPDFSLPIGISFYTFQTMSYTIDVYRGQVRCQKSYLSFMSYVTMFPQLVAGPIVRYSEIAPQLCGRRFDLARFSSGVTRFSVGLFKKAVFANTAGSVAAAMIDSAPRSMLASWLGIIMFTFQIYFDFSGYSDMAIGMGRMIGFDFNENFNYPYMASSITDFWRRWHISLSSFFRDYVYIPLGGNRRFQLRNILIVWFLTGLWHGASWNFVIWGMYFGIILLLEKVFMLKALSRIPGVLRHIYSLALIVIGWALFYCTGFSHLGRVLSACFGGAPLTDRASLSALTSNIVLLSIMAVASTDIPKRLAKKVSLSPKLEPFLTASALGISFIFLVGQSYNPFLYFRF